MTQAREVTEAKTSEEFKRGAREGWMRCGVVHVDLDFENRPESQAEIEQRWPLSSSQGQLCLAYIGKASGEPGCVNCGKSFSEHQQPPQVQDGEIADLRDCLNQAVKRSAAIPKVEAIAYSLQMLDVMLDDAQKYLSAIDRKQARLVAENEWLKKMYDCEHLNSVCCGAGYASCNDCGALLPDDLPNSIKAQLTAAQERERKMREDAERWRALMASPKMHFMGSAGFDKDGVPRPGEDLHFGVEFWNVFDTEKHPLNYSDEHSRKVVMNYADAIRAATAIEDAP